MSESGDFGAHGEKAPPKNQPGSSQPSKYEELFKKCLTKDLIICMYCKKVDAHTKTKCPKCNDLIHICCLAESDRSRVKNLKWYCASCTPATLEISDDDIVIRQQNYHINPSGPGAIPKVKPNLPDTNTNELQNPLHKKDTNLRLQEQNETAPSSIANSSTTIGRESTRHKNATAKNSPDTRSTSSRASVREQLKLLEQERELELKVFQRRREEEEAERKYLLRRRELLGEESQSEKASVAESVRSEEKNSSIEDWLNGNQGTKFDRKTDSTSKNQKTKESRPKPDETSRRGDSSLFVPAWLRADITEKEFLESTVAGNSSAMRHLNLTKSQIQARHVVSKDLPIFSGDPNDWPHFIGMYITTTQQCGFTNEENITRLSRSLKGEAFKAVRTDLMQPKSLATALCTLRLLYGQPRMILSAAMTQIKQAPPVKMEKPETIIVFAMHVKSLCDTMITAGKPSYLYNDTLLCELEDKLPQVLRYEWIQYQELAEIEDPNTNLETFSTWLRSKARIASKASNQPLATLMATSSMRKSNSKNEAFHGVHESEEFQNAHTVDMQKLQSQKCAICRRWGHPIDKCRNFLSFSNPKRWARVKAARICVRCFGSHFLRDCTLDTICGISDCEQPHHPLLHTHRNTEQTTNSQQDVETRPTENQPQASRSSQSIETATPSRILIHGQTNQKAYFQVVPVNLYGENNKIIKTHAFLDGGSTVTLMEEAIAIELGLQGLPERLTLKWTNDISREELNSRKVTVRISGQEKPDLFTMHGVRTTQELGLPTQSLNYEQIQAFEHLRSLPLTLYGDAQPRLLIGIDNYQLLTPKNTVEGAWDDPVAVYTRLGWTLLGGGLMSTSRNSVINHHTSSDSKLHDLVKGFFSLESLGVRVPQLPVEKREDTRAKDILQATVKRLNEGRYEAGLLWATDDVKLPPSRNMALHRLECFERKLKKNPQIAETVQEAIANYKSQGYLEELSPEDARIQTDRTWYLPIFAVTNPNKPEKTRLVWDAAAKVGTDSLNSHLLTGPDLLENLVGVLMKFREHSFAISGDIRQMFHQVRIRREDQDAQRCLWRNPITKEVITYRMTVMTFGAACSPCTAHYIKNLNASRVAENPRAVEAIQHRHYVDDYIDSFETMEECIAVTNKVKEIHKDGGFEIRNFVSNSQHVLNSLIGISETQSDKSFAEQGDSTKILGMIWCTSDDTLRFRINEERIGSKLMHGEITPTKRAVLRILMMIFDPLGLLGFYIVRGKILLKEVWRSGINWDDKIQPTQMEKWIEWMKALPVIETARVLRSYFPQGCNYVDTPPELHIFVDASEHATAAVAYLVVFKPDDQVNVAFVSSRTKIAPNKSISIPRLELQAAVIGARLATTIKDHQSIKIAKVTFWSDSKNVLCWIRSPRTFKEFVAHRIGEILETTNCHDWRWLPTNLNVADEATKWKGALTRGIPNCWYQGPDFLYKPRSEWPMERSDEPNPSDEELEVRCMLISAAATQRDDLIHDVTKYSSLKRLLRIQAYSLRFFYERTFMTLLRPLNPEEIERARQYLIRNVQQSEFSEDIKLLKTSKKLPKKSILRRYSPFIDSQQLIRMSSRLKSVEYLSYDQRCPIIMPRQHHLTDLIIAEQHERYYHQNSNTVINELQQHYVIPQLRQRLKLLRSRCPKCRLRDAKPEYPEMAELPRSRTAARMRPFTYTGVDYFGPITVKIGRRYEKRWGALFTCLTTRAIHLELASSLSSDSFIGVLRIFISRRGMPREMFSDNGTNFRGAEAELKRIVQHHIANNVADHFMNLKWNFNPPAAPHMGGAWERLVRSVKVGLRHALPERTPSEELLRGCLAEIESIINSRPLTYVEVDGNTLEALTPHHFLLGSSSGIKPICDLTDEPGILRQEWKRQQQVTQGFWTRWITDYLPSISQRTQWFDRIKPLNTGDVVAIVDPDKPYSWQLGRVEKVILSKDGNVRQADIRTSSGILRRPASKIAVLSRNAESEKTSNSLGGSVEDGNTSPISI